MEEQILSYDNWMRAIRDKGRIKLPKPKELTMAELSYLMEYFEKLNKLINGND